MAFTHPIALSGLDGRTGFRITMPADTAPIQGFIGSTYDRSPTIATLGDINADGFDDIIIGNNAAEPGTTGAGAAYVLFGRAEGWGGTFDLTALDGSNGFRLTGASAFARTGSAVSGAGDVNGDGWPDLLVGAPGENAAYLLFGRAGAWPASLDLAALNGTDGVRLQGAPGMGIGISVVGAGDVNGDGFADVALTAPGANQGNGALLVLFGQPRGWSASFDLATLDFNNGFIQAFGPGFWTGTTYAATVRPTGDVNGDGYADLLIRSGESGFGSGFTRLLFGKASGWAGGATTAGFSEQMEPAYLSGAAAGAGDINGDGLSDIIIARAKTVGLFGLNAGPPVPLVVYPAVVYAVFGQTAFPDSTELRFLGNQGFRIDGAALGSGQVVGFAGDMNGDGLDEIIIGSPDESAVHIVFGRAQGWATPLDLRSMAPQHGFRLDGIALADLAGSHVSSAGDVNGDGFADLLIAARGADSGKGAVFVYFSPTTGNITRMGSTLADSLRGGAGHDTLDGRAGNDTLDGGPGNDTASFATAAAGVIIDMLSQGLAQVTSGAGIDTLRNIEALLGSRFADRMRGDAGANTLQGALGDDALFAWAGNDSLDGGDGADTLYGSTSGADSLDGGAGHDLLQINALGTRIMPATGADSAFVTIDVWMAPAGLYASYLALTATQLGGGAGHDQLVANPDLASRISGGDGDDTLWGQAQADTLLGGEGEDILRGGAGDDVLNGGAANDLLVGGSGADIFDFPDAAADHDTVFGFSRADGDRIRVLGGWDFAALDISETNDGILVSFGPNSIRVHGDAGLMASDFLFA